MLRWKAIFDRLHATPHPWRSFDLTGRLNEPPHH